MKWECAGIEKIKIPVSASELTESIVRKYLPTVMRRHMQNAEKIKHYRDYVSGRRQAIDGKLRDYNDDEAHNNIVKQNHAHDIVSFKEGLLLGDRREFSANGDEHGRELVYLCRYLFDVSFYGEDLKVKEDIYSCGVGISYVFPRQDIIKKSGGVYRFKTSVEGYDIENESPFVYKRLDPAENAVVYTSEIGEMGRGDLFSLNISKVETGYGSYETVVTVYTRDFSAKYNGRYELIKGTYRKMPEGYHFVPMVEHAINEGRIGPIEIVETVLDGVNTILSSCVDNIVDTVNQIFVFLGCDPKSVDVKRMYRDGGVALPPSNGVQTPDVKTLEVGIQYDTVHIIAQDLILQAYDIVGVPTSTGIAGGGNNQAAYIGGGWTKALSVIKRDVMALEPSDREELKRMLAACRINPESRVGSIPASQIEIKYNVKITDNILAYTQALQNLVDVKMPYEHILKAIPLWGDSTTVAMDWRENVERELQMERKQAATSDDGEATVA